MKGIGKGLVSLMVLMGALWFGTNNVHAQDESIQDSAFTFFNGAARMADSTAPDQYSARMANDNTGWNIQYMNWDFSHLKPGTLYDVYVKVKVKHAASNPSGDAFKIGVYDITDQNFTISEQTITASETEDNVWTDVKIGMFKPNASVNWLSFYVSGTANLTQISDIYVDAFIFIEHETYTIEDNLFFKFNDAAAVVDPMAVDNSNCNSSNIFDLE